MQLSTLTILTTTQPQQNTAIAIAFFGGLNKQDLTVDESLKVAGPI